jgi:hypothetical protein
MAHVETLERGSADFADFADCSQGQDGSLPEPAARRQPRVREHTDARERAI